MKKWFIDRLKERSTYIGLSLALSAAGVVVDAATLQAVGLGIASLIAVVEKEREKESAAAH